nr:cytochrome c family protein [Kiloniella sp. EL199]
MSLTVASSLYPGQAAAGDAAAGKKVFNKCKACHTVGKSKIGPDLAGLFGRPAASVEGYKYSKAMKASGITWTEENLAKFLKKPKAFVPKTKMSFGGLKKEKQIEDLLAYLKEATAQ